MKIKSLNPNFRRSLVTYGIVAAAFILIQILSGAGLLTSSLSGQLVPICAYVIMAISLNLTVGILGELSLGHASFMSVGAFMGAFVSVCIKDALPGWLTLALALLAGTAAAAVVGVLIGIPVLRLQGDYLAIVTLAFGEIIKNLLNSFYIGRDAAGFHISFQDAPSLNLDETGEIIINGAQGITGMPRSASFTLGVVLILITLFVVQNLVDSRTGRAVMSIRDNRIAAESVGINITKYKMIAFTVSAALAGLAGSMYAHNFSTLVARKFDYNTSILVLVFIVVGGLGNIRGSVIAAAALTVLPELLRGFSDYRMLVYAVVLIVMMLFNQSPQIAAWRRKWAAKLKSRKPDGKKPDGKEA
ncbi:MAG: branched-chain amino acid ABC transporter permease [Subdoligranulum sp.]|nr:branched-chain amino acid ABC transporter permease [Subdoligranulum sp.]